MQKTDWWKPLTEEEEAMTPYRLEDGALFTPSLKRNELNRHWRRRAAALNRRRKVKKATRKPKTVQLEGFNPFEI